MMVIMAQSPALLNLDDTGLLIALANTGHGTAEDSTAPDELQSAQTAQDWWSTLGGEPAADFGTDADVALLRGGIAGLPTALRLARRTLATIRQNLFWAFVYNVLGIPIAAGVLAPWTGWTLSPVLASAAMSLSSVSVLMNSLRLRRFAAA